MKARLSTDGGSRGNPGPAAYGYVLEAEDGTVLDARGETIGKATNNVAEYRGLLAGPGVGASSAASTRSRSSRTRSCSSSRCAASTRSRTRRCVSSSTTRRHSPAGSKRVTYTAVRREHNELADRLVNEALDQGS